MHACQVLLSHLTSSYSTNEFPEKYVPTVYDNYAVELKVNGEIVKLSLW